MRHLEPLDLQRVQRNEAINEHEELNIAVYDIKRPVGPVLEPRSNYADFLDAMLSLSP